MAMIILLTILLVVHMAAMTPQPQDQALDQVRPQAEEMLQLPAQVAEMLMLEMEVRQVLGLVLARLQVGMAMLQHQDKAADKQMPAMAEVLPVQALVQDKLAVEMPLPQVVAQDRLMQAMAQQVAVVLDQAKPVVEMPVLQAKAAVRLMLAMDKRPDLEVDQVKLAEGMHQPQALEVAKPQQAVAIHMVLLLR